MADNATLAACVLALQAIAGDNIFEASAMMELERRRLVISAAGLAICGVATTRLLPEEMLLRDRRPTRSRVAILSAEHYSEELVDLISSGLRDFGLNLRERAYC